MDQIKASVIIPTLNKLSRLRLVLKSLEPQITDDIEVIIVFDGCDKDVISSFHELEFAFKPIEVICEINIGRASARNRGIEVAKGEIIIFLDDDRITAPHYIKSHIKRHEAGHVAVLGKRKELYLADKEIENYYNDFEACIGRCEAEGDNDQGYSIFPLIAQFVPWINFFTGNVSVKKADLLKAGCFDEAFKQWGHEDMDLGIRMAYNKVKIMRCEDAVNYHMMHPSNFADKRQASINNMKYLMKKHRKKPDVQMIFTAIMIKQKLFGIYVPKNQQNKYKLRGEE